MRNHPPQLRSTGKSFKIVHQNPATDTPLKMTTIAHARTDFRQTCPKNGEATMSSDNARNEEHATANSESLSSIGSRISPQIMTQMNPPRSPWDEIDNGIK